MQTKRAPASREAVMAALTDQQQVNSQIHAALQQLTPGQQDIVLAYIQRIGKNWSAGPLPDALVPYLSDKSPDLIETRASPLVPGELALVEDHEGVYREYRRLGALPFESGEVPVIVERVQIWALKEDGALVKREVIGKVDEFVDDVEGIIGKMS